MAVGEHAELGGYLHAFQRDVLGPKIAVADEGSGGGEGVGSAAADGGDAVRPLFVVLPVVPLARSQPIIPASLPSSCFI